MEEQVCGRCLAQLSCTVVGGMPPCPCLQVCSQLLVSWAGSSVTAVGLHCAEVGLLVVLLSVSALFFWAAIMFLG